MGYCTAKYEIPVCNHTEGVESGVITFSSEVMNGMVMNRVDILGNDVVKVLITMTEGEDCWAYTDMEIEPFVKMKQGRVIDFQKRQEKE